MLFVCDRKIHQMCIRDRLTPGVDMTGGSLGQGCSVAAGIAFGLRHMGRDDQYVYVCIGDGELNEGQNWEAFQFLAHYKLNNCIVFIDNNKQIGRAHV